MLPDLVAGHVGGILAFHHPFEGFIIEPVELSVAQAFSPFFDQSIKVVGLLQIKIELAVVGIERDELPTDCFVDLTQNCFHMGLEILVWLIAP